MSLESIFYSLAIIAIIGNFLALLVGGIIAYQVWKKYQALKQSAVARMVTAAAAALPKLALFPLLKKMYTLLTRRSQTNKRS